MIKRKKVVHKIVRKVGSNKHVRFVEMLIKDNDKKNNIFTKKNELPRFTRLSDTHKNILLENISDLGWMGSVAIMEIFPEMERSTLGQLIRWHSNK